MPRNHDLLGCGRAHAAFASSAGADVKGVLLGKTPRYAPDRDFDTLHVALDLEIDFAKKTLAGSCRTRVRAFKDGLRSLSFDAVDLKVDRVLVDGERASFTNAKGKLVARLPRALKAGATAEVHVFYRVVDPKSGVHFVKEPVQAWSQSQPEDARFWFPCHDSPHQKATSEARVTVPEGFRAVSNGALISENKSGRKTVFHWRMSRPHSIYLISVAAGRFAQVEDRWEDVPVLYYCEKGREADARRGMGKTPKALGFFSEITGMRYPYEKYAQVAVAEYPGGMENTTCTTQTDAVLIDARAGLDVDLDLLVAHELAHQWFGDLVTCRDWSHAWLNEGFATYFEILFQEFDKGRDEADYELYLNAHAYFDEDGRRYRRPIVQPAYKDPWVLFDRHLYEKGAWVLHMLRAELGEAAWRASIQKYLERHQDKSVETSDLIGAITDATGRNLKPFFDQWVFKAGYPVLRVHYAFKNGRAEVWVLQTQDGEDVFELPLKLRFVGPGWTREFDERLTEKERRFSYKLPGEPLDFQLDPEHRLLKKTVLKKPQRMWAHQLLKGKTAWLRHEAAGQVARWGDADSVALLERALRAEKFWGAAAEMARALGSVSSDASFRALASLVGHKHPKVRRAVVEALGRQGRPQAGPLVAPLARRDPSLNVEAEALRALGALRDGRWRPLLERGLSKKGYRDIPGAGALAGLASLREKRTLAQLKRFAEPGSPFARRATAVRGLSDYAPVSEEVVPLLCRLLEDEDERLTLYAAGELGRLEDERAIPALKKATKGPSARLRVYAEEALARIQVGQKK